ncbi:MAG: PASTA domain-containing protein [Fretibacterium sp.]|nr:PASTA domain-containing protein [Fretibacterium sp.]
MGKMIRWTLLIVVLIIFGSGAVAFYTVFFRPSGEAVVPPLRERSVVEAVEEAERLGFAVQIEQVASSLPEGRVLAQSPEPGVRARRKQVILLQVSKSGELHAVPDVRGQSLPRAQSVIREQGFALGDIVRIQDGGQPAGAVIAQSPAAPANIPMARRIDLLVREGDSGAEGTVSVPNVNGMMEREARALLEESGIKIQTVDRVYSPIVPEGQAIETRPEAGAMVNPSDGVRLKIATRRQPAGFETTPTPSDKEGTGSGTVRKATQPVQQPPEPDENTQKGVTVSVPGQGDIFIGDGTPANTPIREADPNVSVFDQERRKPGAVPATGETPAPRPAAPAEKEPSAPGSAPAAGGGNKTAKIRYQVPPLTSSMNLRIELTDPSGRRDVLNRPAKSGESVYLEAPYSRECVVSVYLGGEFVWQEKHR